MQLFGGGVRYLTEKDMATTSAGVNLYQGTKDFSGTNWVFDGSHSKVNTFKAIKNAYQDFTALEINVSWNGVRQDILVNAGETYTFSGFIKKGSGNPNILFFGDGQTVTNPAKISINNKSINVTDSWSRFSITFSVTTGGIMQPRFESNNGGPNAIYFIAGLKLERGAVPTRWCPAPEDYVMKSDKVLTAKNLIQALFSDELVNDIDDSFDMNNARPGIYRSWGKKPINAPNNAIAWAKYFVIPFVGGDSDFMFQVAIDSNGNMFIRTRGGSPAAWNLWHIVNLG